MLFIFKLLGAGKWIGEIFKQYWKIIVPVLLVCLAYWYHTNAVDNAYDSGVEAEQLANQERVGAQNKLNREMETRIKNAISTFGTDLVNQAAERTAAEVELTSKIETIMIDNPIYEQCVVDPEVLEIGNQIRNLGPRND